MLNPRPGEPVINKPGESASHAADLYKIKVQGGIFGWHSDSWRILAALG